MASAVCSRRSSASSTRSSIGTNATFLTQNGRHAMGKGQVLFTGPSGIRDYKVNVVTDDRFVGIGTMSKEQSAASNYIFREAPKTAPPTRRSAWVGEVGWLIPQFQDRRSFLSGHQMAKSEFRKAQDEKFTHRWQEPWYPAPNHPDYNKQYTFRNLPYDNSQPLHYTRSKTPSPYTQPPTGVAPYQRPHTVASFRQDETFPTLDQQSYSSSRPGSGHQSSEHSMSRPKSGHTSVASRPHSGQSLQSHPNSASNVSRPHTVVNGSPHVSFSRPESGSSSHYSTRSHSSVQSNRSSIGRRSVGSRHSSVRSGSKRMSATPKSTSVSSQYGGHR